MKRIAASTATPMLMVFWTMAMASHAQEASSTKPPATLKSRLKVALATAEIEFEAGKPTPLPVSLTFFNEADGVQRFSNMEYLFAILNSQGEQVKGAIAQPKEIREIILKGKSTIDTPKLFVNRGVLDDKQEYYFTTSVRNLTGLVKFTAKQVRE